jgi:hypothetical protein
MTGNKPMRTPLPTPEIPVAEIKVEEAGCVPSWPSLGQTSAELTKLGFLSPLPGLPVLKGSFDSHISS